MSLNLSSSQSARISLATFVLKFKLILFSLTCESGPVWTFNTWLSQLSSAHGGKPNKNPRPWCVFINKTYLCVDASICIVNQKTFSYKHRGVDKLYNLGRGGGGGAGFSGGESERGIPQ